MRETIRFQIALPQQYQQQQLIKRVLQYAWYFVPGQNEFYCVNEN